MARADREASLRRLRQAVIADLVLLGHKAEKLSGVPLEVLLAWKRRDLRRLMAGPPRGKRR